MSERSERVAESDASASERERACPPRSTFMADPTALLAVDAAMNRGAST